MKNIKMNLWRYTTEGSFMLEHVKDRIHFAHEILLEKIAEGEENPKPVKLYINKDKGYIKPKTAIESIEGNFVFVTEIEFDKRFYSVDIKSFNENFIRKEIFTHFMFVTTIGLNIMINKKKDMETWEKEILNEVLNGDKSISEYLIRYSLEREYNSELHLKSRLNYWMNVNEMIDKNAVRVMNQIDVKNLIPKDYLFRSNRQNGCFFYVFFSSGQNGC